MPVSTSPVIKQHVGGSQSVAGNKTFVLQTLAQFPELAISLLLIIDVDTTKLWKNMSRFTQVKTDQRDLECDPLPH